jgi:hypothetical protein
MTNLQQNNRPLLQIFLVGQEELREMVLSPQLEQLHQRIVAACHLATLSEKDTEQYIKHRLTQVAWQNDPELDPGIFPLIRLFSDGIPRWINLICSRLLLHGMVEELHRLGIEETREVLRGLIDEQLLPGRLYAGNANLLEELSSGAPNSAYSAPPRDDAYQADEEPRESNDFEAESPASEPHFEPEAETAVHDSPMNDPSGKSAAAVLYAELQPLVAKKSNSERLAAFLEFLDGSEIEGRTLALPEEKRQELAATGLAPWFQASHGSFDHAGLSNDILEIMGLATWLKQVQPEIGNEQLETIGLIYKYMQSGKQL